MEITLGPAKPISGTFDVPGDKSISHRALLLASVADGVSSLRNVLSAEDPQSTIRCLRALGVEITQNDAITQVHGKGLNGFRRPKGPLDAGNSGTTMRLLTGLLAGQAFESTVTGDDSLRKRPMQRVIDPLTLMGAHIQSDSGKAPLRIRGRFPLDPITYTLPLPSAQVKSAILLAALYAHGSTTVIEPVATRNHTECMLNLKTQRMESGQGITIVGGMPISPMEMLIPGDISSAVFLICAAALVPNSELSIRNVGLNPTRTTIIDVLQGAGLSIEVEKMSSNHGEEIGSIHVRFSPAQRPITVTPAQVPWLIDEIPALAVLAASSGVGFSVAGAVELRAKESDRISLLVRNLRALGVLTNEESGGLSFENPNMTSVGRVQSGGDHRIAMAFSLAALGRQSRITIDEAQVSEISFPGFWNILKSFQQ
jgi:3-phosphoshikimate 1-carboxyvinyltransferase